LFENINTMANGELVITYYPAGEICSGKEVFDFVSAGTVEAGVRWPGYDAGKNSAFDLLANMMTYYGMTEYINWFNFGGGNELARELYAKSNLYFFPVGHNGAESGIRTTKTAITELADFDGLKLRISSKMAGKIVEKFGGSPLLVAHAEAYDALSKGTIDGGEMGSVTDDWIAGYQEVCPYVSTPAWYQIGNPMVLIINMDAWNALPPHLQKIVEVACQSAQSYVTGYMENNNYDYYLKWVDAGIEFNKLSEEALDEAQRLAAEAFAEEAAKNPDFQRVMDSMMAYLDKASAYNEFVLGRYSQGVGRPKYWP